MSNTEIVTFGCRLNIYESEVIKDLSKNCSQEIVIFNTCAVTKEAERQARQSIRALKNKYPHKKIIVTGCAAQTNPAQFASMSEVDLIIGNEEKLKKETYNLLNKQPEEKIHVEDIMNVKEISSHLVSSFEGKVRAFVQIQNGCNHRCTFCMIPFARGNSRSVPVGAIVNQIKQLMLSGYQEIVLTGVDISDWGLDLPGKPNLANLMRRLLILVPELQRLRLSSIDVAEINDELFELLAYEKRIMPHVHISLQAGDNMILKRMKRRHNREQVLKFCDKLRLKRKEVAFGADIIAGFPTESAEMFENSLNLISEASIQYLHVFPYSEREGTPAAKMPQINKKIRKERAKILIEAGKNELEKFISSQVGKNFQVLTEKNNFGRTENFLPVKINNTVEIGKIINIKVINSEQEHLIAEEII